MTTCTASPAARSSSSRRKPSSASRTWSSSATNSPPSTTATRSSATARPAAAPRGVRDELEGPRAERHRRDRPRGGPRPARPAPAGHGIPPRHPAARRPGRAVRRPHHRRARRLALQPPAPRGRRASGHADQRERQREGPPVSSATMAPVSTPTTIVAVIGNPNTGKSSLFNALTGIRQHVGNYPGITVERKEGVCRLENGDVTLVDLPGTYSLAALSADEQVIIEVLAGRRPEIPPPSAVVCVVDASNLRRNLFLVSQVAETGLPIVVALNMVDEAKQRGIELEAAALSAKLGVPVVPTVAVRNEGMAELRRAIASA